MCLLSVRSAMQTFHHQTCVQLRHSNLTFRMEQTALSTELQQGFMLSKGKHFFFYIFKMETSFKTSSFCPHFQQSTATVDLHSSQVSLYLAVNYFNLEESTKKQVKKKRHWNWVQNAVPILFWNINKHYSEFSNSKLHIWTFQCLCKVIITLQLSIKYMKINMLNL